MKKLNYSQKRQIILSAIAVISIIMVTIFCVMIIFMIYGESLFSAKKVQLKKAENYAHQKKALFFLATAFLKCMT